MATFLLLVMVQLPISEAEVANLNEVEDVAGADKEDEVEAEGEGEVLVEEEDMAEVERVPSGGTSQLCWVCPYF